MELLSVQERNKLRTVLKLIHTFKTELIQNGLSNNQVQDYFVFIINDAFNNDPKSSQKYDFNQLLISIFNQHKRSTLKTLRRLQLAFYLQRTSLQTQQQQQTISRKSSEAISQKIKQKKKEIKEKRKKELKNDKKKQSKVTQENAKINESQTFKFQKSTNTKVGLQKSSNPLGQSNNITNPNVCLTNPFSSIKPQSQAKNFFTYSQDNQNDSMQELRKNIFQINFLKNILEKQIMSNVQDELPLENGINGLLDMATLMFKR